MVCFFFFKGAAGNKGGQSGSPSENTGSKFCFEKEVFISGFFRLNEDYDE